MFQRVSVAQCEVLEYRDDVCVCRVDAAGCVYPEVAFPVGLLKYHGLQAGDAFLWHLNRHDANTTCEDIVPDPLPFAEELPDGASS